MLFKIHAHQPKEHLRHINHHLSCHGRGRTNHQRIFTAKMAMRQVIGHLQTMGSECVNTLIYLDEVLYDLRLTILTPPSHPKKMRGLTGDQDQPFQKWPPVESAAWPPSSPNFLQSNASVMQSPWITWRRSRVLVVECCGGEIYGSVSKPCTPGEHQNSW